jgi:hypothetical protein
MDIHGPGPYLNTGLPPAGLVCSRLVRSRPLHFFSPHFLFPVDIYPSGISSVSLLELEVLSTTGTCLNFRPLPDHISPHFNLNLEDTSWSP